MRTVTVTEAKAHLNELVEDAATTHEQVVITRHGRPAVVLVAADDLESMKETVYWLSRPGLREDLVEARAEIRDGKTLSTEEMLRDLDIAER